MVPVSLPRASEHACPLIVCVCVAASGQITVLLSLLQLPGMPWVLSGILSVSACCRGTGLRGGRPTQCMPRRLGGCVMSPRPLLPPGSQVCTRAHLTWLRLAILDRRT